MSSRLEGADKTARALSKKYTDHQAPEDTTTAPEYDATGFGDWGTYMRHKKQKLQNRNALFRGLPEHQGLPQIFRGIVATVNGYTVPSLQDLTEMIVARGGIMVQYADGKTAVTHVIASGLALRKREQFARYKVVRPEWIVESVKAGKLLPWDRWRVLPGYGAGARQGRLGFTVADGGGLKVERSSQAGDSYKEQTLARVNDMQGTPWNGSGFNFSPTISATTTQVPEPRVKDEEQDQVEHNRPSSSHKYIPDGKDWAVVIPRWDLPKPVEGKATDLISPILAPVTEENLTFDFPSYQLPLAQLSSPPAGNVEDAIPPSQQLKISPSLPALSSSNYRPKVLEIPNTSSPPPPLSSQNVDDQREKDGEERFLVLSFTKSEEDAVENLMRVMSDEVAIKQENQEELSRVMDLDDHEEMESELLRIDHGKHEIQPTSPIDEDVAMDYNEGQGVELPVDEIPQSTQLSPSTQKKRLHTPPSSPPLLQSPTPFKRSITPDLKDRTPSPSPPSPTPTKKGQKVAQGSLSAKIPTETARLLANPRVRSSTVLNPGFLEQYYRESRLHHLSTWKANLKQHLKELTLSLPSAAANQPNQSSPPRRYIFHVDFDCFFAAVSILYSSSPESLKDKPVCVTHASGTSGDVASCNYIARAKGVRNGMWLGQARQLCPDIVTLPYEFEKYEEMSKAFYGILINVARQSPRVGVVVQSVSVDEAIMDVTAICYDPSHKGDLDTLMKEEQAAADSLATSIRDKMREVTRCDVSIGIGSNPLLARLALRKAKPVGQFHLLPEAVQVFLSPLKVHDLPSVGSSTATKLSSYGIDVVGDLLSTPLHRLKSILGNKTGEKLYGFARGVDNTPVTGAGGQNAEERKSVSAEVNWGVRFETQVQAEEFLRNLAGEVSRRLIEQGVKASKMTLKVMKRAKNAPVITPKFLGSGQCETLSKSVLVGDGGGTWDLEILGKEAVKILRGFGIEPSELRGLGIQMTKLEKAKGKEDGDGNAIPGVVGKGQKVLEFKPPIAPNSEPEGKPHGMSTRKWEKSPMPPPSLPVPLLKKEGQVSKPPSVPPPSTQFLIPSLSQIDPTVLAALPESIRESILQSASKEPTFKQPYPRPQTHPSSAAPIAGPAKQSHFPQPPLLKQPQPKPPQSKPNALEPSHRPISPISASQIDPEFLASLTPSLREEILSEYRSASSSRKQHDVSATGPNSRQSSMSPSKYKERQLLFSQSPRKAREPASMRKPISPPKRRDGASASGSVNNAGIGSGTVLFPSVNKRSNSRGGSSEPFPPLTAPPAQTKQKHQAQIKPPPTGPLSPGTIATLLPPGNRHGLDPEVLCHLPRDILDEVIADACRRANLTTIPTPTTTHTPPNGHNKLYNNGRARGPIRCLKIPPARPKKLPKFQGLRGVHDIVDLLESWFSTLFSGGDDAGGSPPSGPNEEDVAVLERYLVDVICVERDMAKARGIVRGFGEVVLSGVEVEPGDRDEGGVEVMQARKEWLHMLKKIVDAVKGACVKRGVPEMDVGLEEGLGKGLKRLEGDKETKDMHEYEEDDDGLLCGLI